MAKRKFKDIAHLLVKGTEDDTFGEHNELTLEYYTPKEGQVLMVDGFFICQVNRYVRIDGKPNRDPYCIQYLQPENDQPYETSEASKHNYELWERKQVL